MRYKLIDLLESKTQGVNTTTDHISYVDKGYKIVQAKNIAPYNITFDESNFIDEDTFDRIKDNHKLHKGEVLYTNIGSQLGNSAIYEFDDEAIITWNVMKLIPNKDIIDNYYLCYLLNSNKPNIKALNTSSTMPFVSGKELMKVEFDVPDLKTQQKVVKVLKNIEDKIKLNNEINNNLYEMGDNLYNEYFGKYKDNLPSDYKIVKLNDVADNFDSKRKPMSSREREQHRGIYPYYGATSIIDYVDDYIFDDTYLLMGEDGTVKTDDGYPVLQYIWGKNWINNHAHVLKGKNISTELLMFALRKINIENIITGAVQPKINQENMNKIEFVIGSDSKNKELEDIFKKLMDKSKNIIEENKRLEELRETLLPKLMNGEIDLDKIEL